MSLGVLFRRSAGEGHYVPVSPPVLELDAVDAWRPSVAA